MMTFAYADPPYPGQAKKHYSSDPNHAEVNHNKLVRMLCDKYPDGWALSTSSTALRDVLPVCPPDVRVAAWVKPFAIFKPNVNPGYTWEPIIFMGGRKRGRDIATLRDWVSVNITLKRGLVGVKPDAVNQYILQFLNAQSGDVLCDIYPGSGGMSTQCSALGVQYLAVDASDVRCCNE